MLNWIVSLYGLLSVLIHGLVLTTQSLALGGVVFLLVVVSPASNLRDSSENSILRWVRGWALLLALAEILYVALDIAILMKSGGFAFSEVISANFALAGLLASTSALAIAIVASMDGLRRRAVLLVPSALILTAATMTSHAVARLDHRLPLIVLTAAHHAATAAWIGGLPYLLISLKGASTPRMKHELCVKFSRLAMVSVAVLVAAGFGLAKFYVGSWDATFSTTYGIMVIGKVILFGILLSLGALNFRIVRRHSSLDFLRRFGEAEIGVGFTVILLAASLASLAPSVDTPQLTLPIAGVAARLAPRWPPKIISASQVAPYGDDKSSAALPAAAAETSILPKASETGGSVEVSWMDDPHHWAALAVIAVGLLALLARSRRLRYARNWPLLFPVLGLILFLMSDSQYWPIGTGSLLSSFLDPVILPHRLIEVLIALFGIFEWRVQTQRVTSPNAGLVFPSLVAVCGTLLLAHSHGAADPQVQPELLSETSHVSIAILGVAGGWSRWLELRLPSIDRTRRVLSWIWPICFLLVGILLATYQGS